MGAFAKPHTAWRICLTLLLAVPKSSSIHVLATHRNLAFAVAATAGLKWELNGGSVDFAGAGGGLI